MTTEHETRIAFAERQGWTRLLGISLLDNKTPIVEWITPEGKIVAKEPDPTSREDVHTALMGMSEEEWNFFGKLLLNEIGAIGAFHHFIINTLKTPLSTLVECYLEATKGRAKDVCKICGKPFHGLNYQERCTCGT